MTFLLKNIYIDFMSFFFFFKLVLNLAHLYILLIKDIKFFLFFLT